MERFLRVPVSLGAGGCDAGGGDILRGRYPFADSVCQADGSFHCHGAAVRAAGDAEVVVVVGGAHCADRVRGGDQRHQLHGRYQRHYGRLFAGGAGAAAAEECVCRVHREFVPGGHFAGGAGVLLLQLQAEEQGEVLCRRCGQRGHCAHHAVRDRQAYHADGRCDLAYSAAGLRR